MNCRYCGAELPEGAMFCGECGRPVEAAAPTPAPALVVPAPPAAADPDAGVPTASPVAFSAPEEASDDPVDHVAEVPRTPTCPQCGEPVDAADVFCGECGFVLRTVPPPPIVAPAPPVDEEQGEPEREEAEPEPERAPTLSLEAEPEAEPESEPDPDLPWTFDEYPEPGSEPVPERVPVPDMRETDVVPALEPDLELSHDRPPRPDPFPWGLRPLPSEDIEATRLSADPHASERFVLQFSTGENVTVTGAGLIGRNPVAQPGEIVDQLVTVFDATKSVSKTHLQFGQESGRFWVSDRFSTNGSVVRQPDSDPRRCEPGRRYFIARGSRVDVGEQFFVVS